LVLDATCRDDHVRPYGAPQPPDELLEPTGMVQRCAEVDPVVLDIEREVTRQVRRVSLQLGDAREFLGGSSAGQLGAQDDGVSVGRWCGKRIRCDTRLGCASAYSSTSRPPHE
jgi:hypothetical protein